MTKRVFNDGDLLEQLIGSAVEVGANGLEIEYKDGREEVCAMMGNVGIGIASLDSSSEEVLALRQRIRKLRKKGTDVTVQGKTYRLRASVFESFGEEAYRIEIGGSNNASERISTRADAG